MTGSKVKLVEVDEHHAGQRIDNFLLSYFAKVPKSRLYRALRKGEVRVNKGRVKPLYRLRSGDVVRLPPIDSLSGDQQTPLAPAALMARLEKHILLENEHLLVLNKPAGIAAHAGSGDRWGVIEILRASRQNQPFLELAHRIDKETSGCLMLAKSRRALLDMHTAWPTEQTRKQYILLVKGVWKVKNLAVSHALVRQSVQAGAAKMAASDQGRAAHTRFSTRETFAGHTLMQAHIETGRTHQIRVHAHLEGYPVAGDKRYGDFEYNRSMRKLGLQRLFLHAESIQLNLPNLHQTIDLHAPLPEALQAVCRRLRASTEAQ